ncbi:MAG: ATP-binding protein, partial [Cyanobacteria bacterium P01_D01_bin.56]
MVFQKRLLDLQQSDVERLIDEKVTENSEVEFKKTLPTKKGEPDPWIRGDNRIGDRARNEIIEELIAFANAYGGYLVLGMQETDDKPPRANGIHALPQCVELAERLRFQCRDCIEPQIPLLEIVGIPFTADGSGVIVCRVPKSLMAPHRHTVTKECYVRRADRSEKMTMREIQDLTLQIERGLNVLEKRLETQRLQFNKQLQSTLDKCPKSIGIRLTTFPLVPILIEQAFRDESVQPTLRAITGLLNGKSIRFELPSHYMGGDRSQRPILRGFRRESGVDIFKIVQEVYQNGWMDHSMFISYTAEKEYAIWPDWVLCLLGNAMLSIEKIRKAANAPNA